ncbi:TlpA family protein disulfide reductase [Mucilaginibacter aquariorum]|uniref:TlpA family protein disulfide reductase n=1 Tax=Mucilaginibacter aquariorum TaxID=2967225 RepID=A0ABT1SXI0_9SPHI|nr:TlpA disulfide reductase family protein [Mucilaginibacter aquariorum]MCQ6957055.1 TlpA family protein disulfide reductase [Mucilaginibacter aquariorum]
MTKKFISFCITCLFISTQTIAQISILKKAVQKINQYQNISYSQIDRQKSPFSGDWITLNVKTSVSNAIGNTKSELYYMQEGRGYNYIFNGSTRIDLDLNRKTYELKGEPGDEPYKTPFYWAKFIQTKLTTSPEKIRLMPDTIINHESCFHVKIVMIDSASSREIHDLCLNKTSYLPVYVKQYLQGKFGKGDMTSDNIALMINESSYTNYNLNARHFENIMGLSIPADFQPEKKVSMITVGNRAPNWELPDLQGNIVSNSQLKGKVTLIDFSFNACAACMLSIPTLNKLHEKYRGSNVSIVTINTSDPKPSVIAFAKKNKINYSILLNGSKVAKSFQISAYPSFYLIDKNGMVAATFEGYSNELENELIEKIDNLKQDIQQHEPE